MVWNRRKNPRRDREVKGKVNPPSAWVWSPKPTHEANVTRELFELASTTGRFRKGSRPGTDANQHPATKRTYLLRSYLRCDLCGRRTYGATRKTNTYYRCHKDARRHAHHPWFETHPANVAIREDFVVQALTRFFADRVFGTARTTYLLAADATPIDEGLARRRDALLAEIAELQVGQDRLIANLSQLKPTGDPEIDDAWRTGIQRQFADAVTQQRHCRKQLADLEREHESLATVDQALIDKLPTVTTPIDQLPDETQRQLYDAFQLDLRYNVLTQELLIRASIASDTIDHIAATVSHTLPTKRARRSESEPTAQPDPSHRQRTHPGEQARTRLVIEQRIAYASPAAAALSGNTGLRTPPEIDSARASIGPSVCERFTADPVSHGPRA